MIAGGVTYPILADLLRKTYVEVAQSAYGLNGKGLSISRISVMTGIHRKEIKRLSSEPASDQKPIEKISLGAKVIAEWCGKSEYLNENGHPIALPRSAADHKPSFEQLVRSVSVDVRPGALLAEWLRSGAVELKNNNVRLLNTAFIPSEGFEEKAYYFGRNLRDHVAAGQHNLSDMSPAFFDRAVYYDRIDPESVEQLRKLCAERGEKLLLEINRYARKLAEQDGANGEPKGRMTFGAYFYGEDNAESSSCAYQRHEKA